jgi:acyl-CoA synthetase (AMP-forming)/AMP-acid ligase II
MALARNVFGLLDRTAESPAGDRSAYGFEGEVRTFRETRDAALAVAGGLHAQGIRPGDRVAVMMGNRLEWVEVYFALAALGAVCVPVNVLLTGPEIAHVCLDSGARYLVADEVAARSLGTIDHHLDLVVTVGDVPAPGSSRAVKWEDVATGHELPAGHSGPALEETFLLYYSSGTTGLPKAAEHSHDGVLWNAMGQLQGLGLTDRNRYFVISSLSWAAGFHNLMMALTWNGGFSEIRRTGGATMDNIVDSIEQHSITHVMLVPSLLRELVTRPDLMERLSAFTLELIVTGA